MAINFRRTNDARRRGARPVALAVALAGAAALALLTSACASSSGAGVARVASATTTTAGAPSGGGSKSGDPAAFSACMRKHGVTNFPDPDSRGRIKITSGASSNGRRFGPNVDSATFKTAQQACRKLLPNGGKPDPKEAAKALQAMLKYSACMRSHGVPKFPDPKVSADGGMLMSIGPGMGVNPGSPQFQAAQKACEKLMPGVVDSRGPAGKP
jgi:hypothetical protein